MSPSVRIASFALALGTAFVAGDLSVGDGEFEPRPFPAASVDATAEFTVEVPR